MKIWHLNRWVFLRVHHFTLSHDQPKLISNKVDKRGKRRRTRFYSEHRRRWVIQISNSKLAMSQPNRFVLAGDLPVSFPHMAYQHRPALKVHGIHFSKMSIFIE